MLANKCHSAFIRCMHKKRDRRKNGFSIQACSYLHTRTWCAYIIWKQCAVVNAPLVLLYQLCTKSSNTYVSILVDPW